MKDYIEQCIFITTLLIFVDVLSWELPGSCRLGQYYEPSLMVCESCPGNSSMVTSHDGFGCMCNEHSIPFGINGCKPCGATEVLSADGTACVPRRCQNMSGKTVCRKCPIDYVSVTQNFDGSAVKEVLCVKCARGYKAQSNVCVRCETCVCSRNELTIRGKCVPKRYLNERPKYEVNRLHPFALLDIVKHEYLCINNHNRSCRTLANECVRNLYTSEIAGPCRLWIQSNIIRPKALPQLTIEKTLNDKPSQISIIRGKPTLILAVMVYTASGGLQFLQDSRQVSSPCKLPITITIGKDVKTHCDINITQSSTSDYMDTLSPILYYESELKPLPVIIRKPNGYYVQRGTWSTNKFRRYFIIDKHLSTTENASEVIYLQTLIIHVRMERDQTRSGNLRADISLEVHYASKSLSNLVTSTLRVEHEMPAAGVMRGLEIWGGVLGAMFGLYAIIQWRGTVRRGGLQFSLVPLLANSIADTLYFAAWFSSLHALGAEAGTLGLTLPLSNQEEYMITTFIYSAVSLKAIKICWFNWNQCRCDIFFLDWSEYNMSTKDAAVNDKPCSWKFIALAKEWIALQTIRKVSPGFTVILTLITLHLVIPWKSYLPQSQGYKWAAVTIAWWCCYGVLLLLRTVLDRIFGAPISRLSKTCTGVGLSVIVFQEEYYAHYVHGRNDEFSDARTLAGPLATCRLACAPQLRTVYKQLISSDAGGLGEHVTKQILLTRLLAAFFERALDGMSWVASERTLLERLLDVELMEREGNTTSTLLYDPDSNTPSCFILTWWGAEWSLATFDAMVFGSTLISSGDLLLSALTTLVVWQILRFTRLWFGIRNLKQKIDIPIGYL